MATRAVIVSAVRTPIGSFGGSLASLSAPALGVAAATEALARAGNVSVDETYFGNVLSAGMGQAPARQVTLGAGLPESVPCTTVNKVCASGMKSVMMAAMSVEAGVNSAVLAGGMESMSNVPFYLPSERWGGRYGHAQALDGILKDGLWDVYDDHHMGMCGENTADRMGITREDQDAHATESYRRAAAAVADGSFAGEIVPVSIKGRGGETVVDSDEEPGKVKLDKVSSLRPAFKKDGSVTAANASSLNDGAAALVVMSEAAAEAAGATPLAVIRGYGDAATKPIDFTIAPSMALPVALERAGVALGDVDYFEFNQAFSVVSIANQRLLDLDPERIDVFGGAVALGHPIGCSGARIITTLLSVLKAKDATVGAASICNGGGGASAIVVERL